jgi:hypothetical protein
MAITAERIVAGATAVALNDASTADCSLVLTNISANGADIGDSAVAAGNGFDLPAGATVTIDVDPGDQVFAVRSGTQDATIGVLRTDRRRV